MQILNLKAQVAADRRLVVQLPEDMEPGEVEVTVRRADPKPAAKSAGLDWFPTLHVKQWDPSTSLRREDLYGPDA